MYDADTYIEARLEGHRVADLVSGKCGAGANSKLWFSDLFALPLP